VGSIVTRLDELPRPPVEGAGDREQAESDAWAVIAANKARDRT
jgi:hypothetical protein